ncbi:MAG: MCP four helix bundle domain-containing protein [Pedobacter sp.]
MKLAYGVKQKTKIAAILLCILACTMSIRALEERNIKSLNSSFSSVYSDRLVPTILLFDIAEHLHARSALFNIVSYDESDVRLPADFNVNIAAHDAAIRELLTKYEKTYLVESEKQQLRKLKSLLTEYKLVEHQIALYTHLKDTLSARRILDLKRNTTFDAAFKSLKALMNIQNQVGEELIKDSTFIISDSKLYSALQSALAVIIGVLIVNLVFVSKVTIRPTDNFHLN